MHSEKCIALSKYRIEEAREFLNSGIKNLEMNEYKTANNRAYYSVFHAMRAVLALDEVDFKKHSGVIAYFRENYVKTNIFDRQYSDIISSTSLIRNKSDYDDFYIAEKQETEELLDEAKKFVSATEEYLKTRY
ncbi:MAG: HEPN domain-containing protein [Clostridiales bacterium]|nr:HEPN domain-containing protein [Clostridiales bacterium]